MNYVAQETDGTVYVITIPPGVKVDLGVGAVGFDTVAEIEAHWPGLPLVSADGSALD